MTTERTDSPGPATGPGPTTPTPEGGPDTKPDSDGGRSPGPSDRSADALGNRINDRIGSGPGQAEGLTHEPTILQIETLIAGGNVRVAGDFFSGGKTVREAEAGAADGEAVTGLPAELELEKLAAVFVEPAEHPRAARILGEQRLVVLRGPAGNGKRAMALHLLRHQGARVVAELSPDTEPAKLATYPFADQSGYLVDTLLPDPARQLNSYMLRRLAAVLGDRNSHLVITVDQRPDLPPDARDYLVECVDVPDRAAMLRRHLAWYLRGTAAGSGEGLEVAHDEVQEYLRQHPRPVSVDRLARLLRRVVLGEESLAAALRQAGNLPGEQAASIFAGSPDLAHWSLVVAVAVLHGASYPTVLRAAERLEARLRRDLRYRGRPELWEPGIPRAQRISQAKAMLVDDQEMSQYGPLQVERVTFEYPELRPAVLDHVWRRYDQLRRPLLDWLRELGGVREREVQIGAAAAAGYLLSHAFRHVFNQVLLPWAMSDDETARTTAARAFGVPIHWDHLAPVVLAILEDWADRSADWRLRWTAAESYGRAVGTYHPEAALRDLRLIGKADHDDLNWIAGCGISYLAIYGRLTEAVAALLDWTDPGTVRPLRTTGLIGFCELALRSHTASRMPGYSPILLERAADGAVSREAVELLWQRALGAARTVEYAAYALRGWLRAADREGEHLAAADAHLEPWLRRLLVELLAPDSGVSQRLRQFLRRSAYDQDRPSRLARVVLEGESTRGTA